MPLPSIELRIAKTDWSKEINQDESLSAANRRKHFKQLLDQEQETNRQFSQEKYQRLILEWDAWKFYQKIKNHINEKFGRFHGFLWQKDYIRIICLMLSKYIRFETEYQFCRSKGILVKGVPGIGKTEIIRAVSDNPVQPIKIISILDIADMVKENGFCDINMAERILIDDVGTEPEVINHFGTRIIWFKDFITSNTKTVV